MPRPLYIMCAESGSVDKYTNRPSLFNVIENVTVNIREMPDETVTRIRPLNFVVVACWEREDADSPEDVFEAEAVIALPGQEPQIQKQSEFSFSLRFHRFFINIEGDPPVVTGAAKLASRVRRKGSEEWASQEYRLQFDVHNLPAKGDSSSASNESANL